MKIHAAIEKLLNRFSKKQQNQQHVKECQLLNILRTEMFRKMSVPDKLTSLAKLAALFQSDFNTVPRKFTDMMVTLTQELNKSILDSLK